MGAGVEATSEETRARFERAKTSLERAPARTTRPNAAFVAPGERIPGVEHGDFLRGHGTRAIATASTTDETEETLVATTAGVVERVNKLVSVRALKSRYVPETGDVVLGKVTNVSGKRWILDINARQNGVLQLSAVHLPGNVQRRRNDVDELNMRTLYAEGDIVSSEVQSVYSDGAAALHTRSLKYGRLKRGQLVRVTANLVRRLPQHFHRLEMDEFHDSVATGTHDVEILLGCNGYIWVGAPSAATAPRETELRREPNDAIDDLNEAYGDKVPLPQRENISRVALAVRALAELFLPISPPAVMDVFKVSKEWGVAVQDMLGQGFLTRILEREVDKRVEAYEQGK
ncbi:Exosome complex RNA-binding protein 1/RRP40/RRP4 [Ostreococcus tauri]|uniref:Exosome complex RNA-binding protein 1/RRP40/RRP4 n=1 Tax=Ostreococcus tauri TaxID=70448 RepID=A0A090N3I5_OSTTA|nr:Exosome complex RNA-binding protein 1/RRP40/RRP4 [Ostreococcus tauri]CEF98178.1 Exosome complex RNA-binding protein 1/RRP40/RRP4 [Ostreococcus tauri]|eukprot:XP_022839122.1 Exosome complex RNA-binding protein 1/RRP40/RRP4 [Ostreococcus tauri]